MARIKIYNPQTGQKGSIEESELGQMPGWQRYDPAAGAVSTNGGKSIKAPWWSQDPAPLQHTYVDPKNPSAPPVKVEAKGVNLPWKNKESQPPSPGMERKYPGGVPGAVRGALQGFTYNFADDVLDAATGGKGEYQDLYDGTARENPGLWGVSNAAGAILARNPLSAPAKVAGGALRTAGAAVGPMTRGADRAVRIVEGVGGNGLINTPNRVGAMLTHATRAGIEGSTANLGAQPQGEKDLAEAGKAGLEGMGLSTLMQVAGAAPLVGNLVPGSTGVGRFLQSPEAQITPSGSQFVPASSLQKPTGWSALLNPAKQADYLATRINPESLMDEAGDAAVSASRASPGVAQTVLDSRSRLGSTPTEFGRTMVSYKIPKPMVEPPSTNGGRALAWLQQRWPGVFGTGEVPLLPPGSKAPKAAAVYQGAIRAANDVVDEVDRKAGPINVSEVLSDAQGAVDASKTGRLTALAGDTSEIEARLGAAEGKMIPPGSPHPLYVPVASGELRTGLNSELRQLGDYLQDNPQAPLNSAAVAGQTQGAVGRVMDRNWQSSLSPEDLQRGQSAKDLLTIAHAGADITNPMRGAVAAPRSLDSSLKAILAGGALTPALGPAGGIAGRNIASVVDKASDINPQKMQLARRAEGVVGQGIGPKEQAVGAFIRSTRNLPGRVNSAIVQGVEEDGPLMSMPDEPNVGPWQNALNKFLANLKR